MGSEGVRGSSQTMLALVVTVALTGCSSNSLTSASTSSGGSSFRDRMGKLFFGSPEEAQAAANLADPNLDCPLADIRSGASTLQINTGTEKEQSSLRYQATIARLARECAVSGPTMTIKVGVQGRVILGPAGGPGQMELPLRYALIQEGPEPKTILTKLNRFSVTIAEGQTNVPFLQVEEGLTFSVPPRVQLENYVVYVGFDAAAMKEQPAKKEPPGKKARRPH
jgi:hypothetical protein